MNILLSSEAGFECMNLNISDASVCLFISESVLGRVHHVCCILCDLVCYITKPNVIASSL